MMASNLALLRALDVATKPRLAFTVRHQALADGVLELIKIVAGDPGALSWAVSQCGHDQRFIIAAAEHYLQEVLFSPYADCFRTLGVRSDATKQEMRTHLRWLMKWLHPDHAKDEWRTIFAARVLDAWKQAQVTKIDALSTSNGQTGIHAHSRTADTLRVRQSRLPRYPKKVYSVNRTRLLVVKAMVGVTVGVGVAMVSIEYAEPGLIGSLGQWFTSQTEPLLERMTCNLVRSDEGC